MSFSKSWKEGGYDRIVNNPKYLQGPSMLNDEGVKAFERLEAINKAKAEAAWREQEAARLRVDNVPKYPSFAIRNAVRDRLYDAFLAAQAAAPYVPTMVGGAYAAAPIVSGMRDYYDYQTMPRDEFYAQKLANMYED